VAEYGRELMDHVRVDEANRLRCDTNARRIVKGSGWLHVREGDDLLTHDERDRLLELLKANKQLATVSILTNDPEHLADYRYPGAASRFWQLFYERVMHSRIRPLVAIAKKRSRYLDGILAHFRRRIHISLLEGINNETEVIKRVSYGFRDDEYILLTIGAGFPGIPG
jgi:transposase